MIKTWQERCEEHQDHEGIVSEGMIRARMQEEIDELRQALEDHVDLATVGEVGVWGEKPPVKTYSGGKPNYCTMPETLTLDRGCYERGCAAYDERDGDGVTIYDRNEDA